MANCVERTGWDDEHVMFCLPLRRLFLLNAASAWNRGLEPSGMTYIDQDIQRAIIAAQMQ